MSEQEKNKLIERTCKFDAYQSVLLWSNGLPDEYGNTVWFVKEKMLGHLDFLKEHKYCYDYANGFILNDGRYEEKEGNI